VCGFWPVSVINSPARNCAAFWLMLVGVWVAFPSFCRTMRERQHNAAVERSLELMTAEVKVRRTALDEARRIRHDHRHHRIVLAGLLLRGKSDEALEYLNALDEEKGDMGLTTHVWCENETVNAILAGCLRKAMSMAVAFSAEVHVERTTPLSDVEIVAVIANLVENAINACGKVEGEQRRVCVALRQRGDMFGMTVTNTVPTGFRLSSAELPCAEFGVGLRSVRRVVDRYSGDWRYTLDGSELTCELVLCAGGSDGNCNL